MNNKAQIFWLDAAQELLSAQLAHDPLHSAHEAYAVIAEELDEFWTEVKKKRAERSPQRMREELLQIAAMCARTAVDLDLPESKPMRRERPRLNMSGPADWPAYDAYCLAGGTMDYEDWHNTKATKGGESLDEEPPPLAISGSPDCNEYAAYHAAGGQAEYDDWHNAQDSGGESEAA